jgi:hypothetical protein
MGAAETGGVMALSIMDRAARRRTAAGVDASDDQCGEDAESFLGVGCGAFLPEGGLVVLGLRQSCAKIGRSKPIGNCISMDAGLVGRGNGGGTGGNQGQDLELIWRQCGGWSHIASLDSEVAWRLERRGALS